MNFNDYVNKIEKLKSEYISLKLTYFDFFLPITKRITSKTIGLDLVSVKPMSKPRFNFKNTKISYENKRK